MLSAKIVFALWKIIGLCPYWVDDQKIVRFSYIGVFYSTGLAFLYSVCFVRAILGNSGIYGDSGGAMAKISGLVASSCECCMVVTTWLTFAYSQHRFRRIQISFHKILNSCARLGIIGAHIDVVKRISKIAVFFNSTWSFCFLLGNLYPPEHIDFLVWIPFNLGHVVFPNFIMFYVGIMRSIHALFILINKKLREIPEVDGIVSSIRESIGTERSTDCGIEVSFTSDHLATLGRVHTELVELTRYIIDLMSPSLYATIGIHLFQMSSIFYALCVSVREGKLSRLDSIGWHIVLHFGFCTHILSLIGEVSATEFVVKEANDTANVLHEVLTARPTKQNIESGTIWSLRMLQDPLTINIFGVLRMESSIIYTIFGSVTGYATIMLQLDDLERSKHVPGIPYH